MANLDIDVLPEANNSVKQLAPPTIRLWILRLLVLQEGIKRWAEESEVSHDTIAYAIGLNDVVEGNKKYSRPEMIVRVRDLFTQEERVASAALVLSGRLEENIETLARVIGLDAVERRVLAFLITANVHRSLSDTLECLGSLRFADIPRVISTALKLPEESICDAVSNGGKLTKCGLIKHASIKGVTFTFEGHIDFVTDELPRRMMTKVSEVNELFKDVFSSVQNPVLTIDSYSHMQEQLDLLLPYLLQSIAVGEKGVNILLYGPPGMGKTQLTRVIAKELGVLLFEISTEGKAGEGLTGVKRLQALRVAQILLSSSGNMLVLDECEDVFGNSAIKLEGYGSAQGRKGWINRSLEDNRVPCFWLTNSIGMMDPAYIRRFSMVVETKPPCQQQRRRIIDQICKSELSASLLEQLSKSETLAPAVVERAHQVVSSALDAENVKDREVAVVGLINTTLRAQGHSQLRITDEAQLPMHYSPSYCNADVSLGALVEGIGRQKTARLCFYGPPGTGKSAFAYWLARSIGLKVITKRGSDLISPFVGGTEANLAAAFEQATREEALLLFDELDSFLQDRGNARNNWEITEVNEFLTQLESYQGVFIGTTNRREKFDMAASRRFDDQVLFDYLCVEQIVDLFEVIRIQLGLPSSNEKENSILSKLKSLTPGDFQMLVRRSRFRPFDSTQMLVESLKKVNYQKGQVSRPIGFIYPD